MTEKESGLPPLEQIREESTMQIITINTTRFERKSVETSLIQTNPSRGLEEQPVIATLIKFDDVRVKGFMPSKVWNYTMGKMMPLETNFNVLFYINSTMPQAVRPFKDNMYLMFFFPEPDDVLEYDVNIRFFMDQVPVEIFTYTYLSSWSMAYVIMFGDEAYNELIVKELNDDND